MLLRVMSSCTTRRRVFFPLSMETCCDMSSTHTPLIKLRESEPISPEIWQEQNRKYSSLAATTFGSRRDIGENHTFKDRSDRSRFPGRVRPFRVFAAD